MTIRSITHLLRLCRNFAGLLAISITCLLLIETMSGIRPDGRIPFILFVSVAALIIANYIAHTLLPYAMHRERTHGDVARCRACGHQIHREAPQCPECGLSDRLLRRALPPKAYAMHSTKVRAALHRTIDAVAVLGLLAAPILSVQHLHLVLLIVALVTAYNSHLMASFLTVRILMRHLNT